MTPLVSSPLPRSCWWHHGFLHRKSSQVIFLSKNFTCCLSCTEQKFKRLSTALCPSSLLPSPYPLLCWRCYESPRPFSKSCPDTVFAMEPSLRHPDAGSITTFWVEVCDFHWTFTHISCHNVPSPLHEFPSNQTESYLTLYPQHLPGICHIYHKFFIKWI